jgi:YD repeat-containing protein
MRFREVLSNNLFAPLPPHFPTQNITADQAGNLVQFTDRGGQVTAHIHDGRNQLVSMNFGANSFQ